MQLSEPVFLKGSSPSGPLMASSQHTLGLFLCLQVEKLARTLFLWKMEVHDQKERVNEMRRWNEALVTNMLPEHVARHFLGSKKRDEVRLSQGRDRLDLTGSCPGGSSARLL